MNNTATNSTPCPTVRKQCERLQECLRPISQNKAARAWMEENIDVLYAAEYAAQQLLSEAMDTLQMLPKEEVCNNA